MCVCVCVCVVCVCVCVCDVVVVVVVFVVVAGQAGVAMLWPRQICAVAVWISKGLIRWYLFARKSPYAIHPVRQKCSYSQRVTARFQASFEGQIVS